MALQNLRDFVPETFFVVLTFACTRLEDCLPQKNEQGFILALFITNSLDLTQSLCQNALQEGILQRVLFLKKIYFFF